MTTKDCLGTSVLPFLLTDWQRGELYRALYNFIRQSDRSSSLWASRIELLTRLDQGMEIDCYPTYTTTCLLDQLVEQLDEQDKPRPSWLEALIASGAYTAP